MKSLLKIRDLKFKNTFEITKRRKKTYLKGLKIYLNQVYIFNKMM